MSHQDRKVLRQAVVEAAARCFRAQHSFEDENVQRLLRDIGRNLKLALDATDAAPPAPGWTRRLRAIWDSEAARAGRREDPGCHAWYACDDASVSVRPRGGLARIATSLNPADLDPGQAEDLARHLQACAAWLRAQKDGGR